MAKQQKKLPKQDIQGIMGDITFGEKDVTLWVGIPSAPYDFQEYVIREQIAENFSVSLSNMLTSEDKGVDFQLLKTSQPFDSTQWVRDLFERSQRNNPLPYLRQFLADMHRYVEHENFRESLVMLGIRLGSRLDFLSTKSLVPIEPLNNLLTKFAGVADEYMSDKEYKFWNDRANPVRLSLYSSRLRAHPIFAEQIAYVIRKQFFPAMPSPSIKSLAIANKDIWGEGEIAALTDAEIENNSRYLRITQMIEDDGNGYVERVGYRATLCFSKFPSEMNYPENFPWIHYASLLDFPTDFSSRFSVEPSRKVRKEVNKKLREVEDQARNQTSAGGAMTMQVQEDLMQGEELDFILGKTNAPWIFGRHRISVEAPTEAKLNERIRRIVDAYKHLGISVVRPTGDQFNLFLEGLPNDHVRLLSYFQRHELNIIAAGVPSGSGTVGDFIKQDSDGRELGWIGPYLGQTVGASKHPVFLSVHSAIARNNPPGIVITGSPGGGKSFTAFTLIYQMALQGIWTIAIDPKGDALPMMRLPGLEKAQLIDLRSGQDGILDPFGLGETMAEKKDLALEIIGLLLGGGSAAQMTSDQYTALSKAIQKVSAQPNPSLSKIVDELLKSTDSAGEALGQRLDLIRDLPFARLAFAAGGVSRLSPDEGLTLITLQGLDLPDAETKPDVYSNSNKLAVAIMFLLTSYTRNLMIGMSKKQQKAIIIDEAWSVTSTPQGQKMIQAVARLGRSLNTGLILVSQNAGDFTGDKVLNSVATSLAFRAKTLDEIRQVLEYFNLEESEENIGTIRNLEPGTCLMKDAEDRIAIVRVDAWNPVMKETFDSNPETRKTNT